jgi:DNA polymerase
MTDLDLEKLINETSSYAENLNRFYGNSIYVERRQGAIEAETAPRSKNRGEQPAQQKEGRARNANEYSVVDLFGNIVDHKEEWEFSESIEELHSQICECQKCVLGKSRTKFVFGVGNPKADLVLVGEAPGADEDARGEPFVGRAGQLLNKILESVGLKREEVYICNILKCRPPGNRNPMPDEIEKCLPYLKLQIELINPKLILALGKFAAEALLKIKDPLNKMRGKTFYYNGIKTMVTFHPAALLRNPQWKRPTWEDMQDIKKIYDELIS